MPNFPGKHTTRFTKRTPETPVAPAVPGLKGHNSSAQGNALGFRPTHGIRPEGAEQKAAPPRRFFRPFRAWMLCCPSIPRALPWAGESQPFRLNTPPIPRFARENACPMHLR